MPFHCLMRVHRNQDVLAWWDQIANERRTNAYLWAAKKNSLECTRYMYAWPRERGYWKFVPALSRGQRRKEAKDCRKRNNVDLKGFLPSMPSIGISALLLRNSKALRTPGTDLKLTAIQPKKLCVVRWIINKTLHQCTHKVTWDGRHIMESFATKSFLGVLRI